MEVVTGVHFDEVSVDAPFAERGEGGARGKRDGKDAAGLSGGGDGEHKLVQEEGVGVAGRGDVAGEAGAEGGPTTEVVEAED